MLWAFTISLVLFALAHCGMLSFCREAKDCSSCAQSYTYAFGLREYCRWCVDAKQCVGPLSCPPGRAVVQRDSFRCPKKDFVKKSNHRVGGLPVVRFISRGAQSLTALVQRLPLKRITYPAHLILLYLANATASLVVDR
ncbi:hypothetical protein RB195_024052 [Necator americanus]|uniref:TNFR-Cys domain-containing protein n=1 Tax=Necator americanus TaxID=51031 RepID=A0ABR1ELN6_NECAM